MESSVSCVPVPCDNAFREAQERGGQETMPPKRKHAGSTESLENDGPENCRLDQQSAQQHNRFCR